MLVTLKEILKIAEEKEIAIGSFNVISIDTCRAAVEAAEELDCPVILQFAQCHEIYAKIQDVAPIMLKYAKESSVPICVHLDHGEDFDYIKKALSLGFSGVMFDGSTLPYEKNIEIAKKVVEIAHQVGSSVEAELGSMGRRESGDSTSVTGNNDETKIYTDPKLAKEFVEHTGIDALACSFGTTHGVYLTKPKLNFDIVKDVRKLTNNIPVVMHGGSGVSEDDYKKAIKAGVRKINYFTYMDIAAGNAMKEKANSDAVAFGSEMNKAAREAMKNNLKKAITVFCK